MFKQYGRNLKNTIANYVELTKGPPAKRGADWKRKRDIGLGSPTKVLGGERVCDKS